MADEETTAEKHLKKLHKYRQALRKEAVQALGNSEAGREYIRYLFEISGLDKTPFTGNALTGAFSSGEFNVGLQIKSNFIEHSPEGYLELLKENANAVLK